MSRTMRYAVLALAVASVSACSNSVTEPTPARPKCVAAEEWYGAIVRLVRLDQS